MRGRRKEAVKKRVDATRSIVGVEDMVLLEDVRDTGIVSNLKARLNASQIYTNIGHVLVACNPYKWMPIYEESTMRTYAHQNRIDMEPHIFATAEAAYRGMVTEEDNQCVIISGESGAGKTEASKQIQSYIATVSGGSGDVENIKKVFLESNPVLEAFGNAKTLRNNNSSRFGKYFEIKFNRFGVPQGGLITNYLLEKSRIVRPGQGERNFHVFYQLIASKQASPMFKLSPSASSYDYLSLSGCSTVDGIDDRADFDLTMAAMGNVGIKGKQAQSILNLLAAVLHIGNVKFSAAQVGGAEGSRVAKGSDALACFCTLLALDSGALAHALTHRELQTMAPGGKVDVYQVPQSPAQAGARRDAVAKAIYERLFDLIVQRINAALDTSSVDSKDLLTIGVLDIYGFEIFTSNGFEQLCINYVNEKLQQIFIELTLRAEQEEYDREGIAWAPIPFFNNKVVCELLDGAKPPGAFRILDDTCKTMHGTSDVSEVDRKFLEAAARSFAKHEHFQAGNGAFVIKHYAGNVAYSLGKFGEANKDALNKDLVAVLKTAEDKLIQFLFPEEIDPNDKTSPPTASARIRAQCSSLVAALMECSPHYVRCIKSNDNKAPLSIDNARAQHQVKYLGLAENIKVRRAGFAYRAEYHRFLSRFGILSKETYPEYRGADKDGCRAILKAIASKISGLTKDEAQLGKSKVFIRQPETYFAIERLREVRLGDFVAAIQRAWRQYSGRREYVKLQAAIAQTYAENRKVRRRDSVFRPFSGDYLDALKADVAESVRDGIYAIIDTYDRTETVAYADSLCKQLVSASTKPFWQLDKKVVVMTNAAIYLIDFYPAKPKEQTFDPPKALPLLVLRRRIAVGAVEGVHLSLCGDTCVVLLIKPQERMAAPNQAHWGDDAKYPKCHASGEAFGLFVRRHHCRVTGHCYVDSACNFMQTLPDYGFYSPQRVSDSSIGLQSTDVLEDTVLCLERKSEFVALLMVQYGRKNNRKKLPITFSNGITLRGAESTGLSKIPAKTIAFVESTSVTNVDSFMADNVTNKNLKITAPKGLGASVVEEKRQRQAERQKKAEKRRKREEEARRQRSRAKEAEREAERLARLEEKKARKLTEKSAKRQAEEQVEAARGKVAAAKQSTKKFGGPPTASVAPVEAPQMTELQKRMAAMRAKNGE